MISADVFLKVTAGGGRRQRSDLTRLILRQRGWSSSHVLGRTVGEFPLPKEWNCSGMYHPVMESCQQKNDL